MLQTPTMYSPTSVTHPLYPSPWYLSAYHQSKLSRLPLDFEDQLPGDLMRDPHTWSREDIVKWLNWCEREFTLSGINPERFFMNGKALCMLKKEDFVERAPNAGDVLYNYLQQLLSSSVSVYSQSVLNYRPLSPPAFYRNGSVSDHYGTQQRSPISPNMPALYSMTSHCRSPEHKNSDSTVFLSPAPSNDSRDSPLQDSNQSEGLTHPNSHHSRLSPHSPECHDRDDIINHRPDSSPHHQHQHYRQPFTSCRLLWDFIYQLLTDPSHRFEHLIKWKDEVRRIFKIISPTGLAQLWGIQKNHTNMNFDKMSRALRYYYRVGILRKEPGERHCYRFLCSIKDLRGNKQRALPLKQLCIKMEDSGIEDETETDPICGGLITIRQC